MTIRIIQEGRVPQEIARVTCRDCNTIFECSKSDGEFVADHRDGDCIKLACPRCCKVLWIAVSLFRKHTGCSICNDPNCDNPGGKH